MRERLYSSENRKWWTLGAVAFGLFMIMLDNTVVNVALPSIQRDLGRRSLRARMDRHRLRAELRRADADRRQARRHHRPAADLRRRDRDLHGLVALLRHRRQRPRSLIGARVVQGVGAALMNPATLSIIAATFPPRAAWNGDRHLGGRVRARARDRPARRRPDHRARQLELDLLRSTSRSGSSGSSRASCSSTSRRTPRTSSASTCPGS